MSVSVFVHYRTKGRGSCKKNEKHHLMKHFAMRKMGYTKFCFEAVWRLKRSSSLVRCKCKKRFIGRGSCNRFRRNIKILVKTTKIRFSTLGGRSFLLRRR